MKNKITLRQLARLALFSLLAALVLIYTDRVLWDKNGTIMGFYEEPKNTIDVLYVGGSHTNAAISPTQIYTEYGCTGYVLYSWGQPIWTTYHYLIEGLKTQSPKVAVVDVSAIAYNNSYMTDVDTNSVSDQYSLLIPPSWNRLQLAIAMSRCQTAHKPFYSYFSLFQYHNNWKALTVEDLLWPLQSYRTTGKGFGPLYTTESYDQQLQPDPLTVYDDIYPQCEEYLYKIIDLCRENDVQLVLANYPYIATETEYGLYEYVRGICAQEGIPFFDYLLDDYAQEIGFDYQTDMAEHAHVNYKGAEKISAHLGQYLSQTYQLPDHRDDPAYAGWAQDAAYEARNLQDMDLRVTQDFAQLMQKATTADYTTVLAVRGDMTAADASALRAPFAALGLPEELFDSTEAAALYIWESGKQTLARQGGAPLTAQLQMGETTAEISVQPQQASVRLNGEEVCKDRPGLDLVIFNSQTGELVQSITFSTEQDYTAFTE